MAPDEEEIIRRKVNEAELTVVDWNHTRVWENLAPGKPKASPFRWFVAAASFGVIVAGLFVVVPAVQRKAMNERIISLEEQLRERTEKISEAPTKESIVVEEPCNDFKTTAFAETPVLPGKKITRSLSATRNNIEPLALEVPNTSNDTVRAEIPSVVSTAEPSTDPKENPITEKKIVAIVGVIRTPSPVVARPRNKKVKILVVPESDPTSVAAAAETNNSFTARLN